MLINPPIANKDRTDIIEDRDIEDVGFGVGFTALNTCKPVSRDPFPEVQDVKSWVGSYLREKDGETSGRVGKFVQERLGDEAKAALGSVMQS